MNQIEKIKLRDLLPNPFRNMSHYRIPEEKIKALIRSFETSGIWPTVLARRAGDKVEQAFGHARKESALQLYGPDHQIEVVIMDLNDEQMLHMMADENGELWGTDFLVDMETVQAVIDAYSSGKITLESPKYEKFHASGILPYTASTIGKFLGWVEAKGNVQARVEVSIRALNLIKEGILKIEQFRGLGIKNAAALVSEAAIAKRRVETELESHNRELEDLENKAEHAKSKRERESAEKKVLKLKASVNDVASIPIRVGEAVSDAMKSGKVGYRNARKITDSVTDHPAFKPLPPSGKFIGGLCTHLALMLGPRSELGNKIQAVLDAKDILPKEQLARLGDMLVEVSNECLDLAFKINPASMEKRVLPPLLIEK